MNARFITSNLTLAVISLTAFAGLAQEMMPMPRPTVSQHGVSSRKDMAADDDRVGRAFVPAMPLPEAPPGVEPLMEQPNLDPEQAGLPLSDLLTLATQNNPTLLQSRQQIDGTLGKALEAGLWPNPTVFYIGEQMFVRSMSKSDTVGEFQGGAIQQEIVTAGKRDISRRKYLARARAAEWLAVAQQWKVCNDVRIHFWRTLGHRQIVDIRRELLKSAEDSALTTRERYNLGQSTRADLHMSNVSLQRARLSLLNAENMYRGDFGILTSLVGMELEPQPLQGTLDDESEQLIDLDATVRRYYSESPEVLAAQAKWQADSITLERERVQPIPNVFVRVGSGYNFETSEPVASAQVFLDVPVWDRNQGTIQQAQADLMRQSAEIRRTQLRLRRDLSDRYQQYLSAAQHVREFRLVILPEARQAYANQLDAYQEDRQNWGDVLDAQREYFDLREQFVENLIKWRTNQVLIEGFLLHGGLEAAPDPTPPGHIDANPRPR